MDEDPDLKKLYETTVSSFPGLIVAIAQNYSTNAQYYPAAINSSNVISVGATDLNDNFASFSNYGDWVDLAAPGVDIYSTKYLSVTKDSGTSYSAPFVTGAAALIWSINPNLSVSSVRNYILNNVDVLSSLSGKVATSGRLNVFAAVSNAAGYIMGDVDFDGKVTAADSRLALRFSSQLELLTKLQLVFADVNYDDVVTAADSRLILQMASGLA